MLSEKEISWYRRKDRDVQYTVLPVVSNSHLFICLANSKLHFVSMIRKNQFMNRLTCNSLAQPKVLPSESLEI